MPSEAFAMFMLASNFDGIEYFLLGGICLILMAVASYIGSARGHWSGPLLASPLLLGIVAFIGVGLRDAPEPLGVAWMVVMMSPLFALSGGSILVWMIRRKAG